MQAEAERTMKVTADAHAVHLHGSSHVSSLPPDTPPGVPQRSQLPCNVLELKVWWSLLDRHKPPLTRRFCGLLLLRRLYTWHGGCLFSPRQADWCTFGSENHSGSNPARPNRPRGVRFALPWSASASAAYKAWRDPFRDLARVRPNTSTGSPKNIIPKRETISSALKS